MRSLLVDARYGIRMMGRMPGFTLAAVLTLAIGIGATSAIFTLVNVLSWKPLAYRDPSRVAFLFGHDTESGDRHFNMPIADYLDIRKQSQTLEQVTAYVYLSANLTGGDIPERVQAYRVTADTFNMLGVPAALGRTLAPADGVAGQDRVAVLADGIWRRRFGADPSVIGRTIMLNGQAHEVVGVMPPRFEYPVFNFKGDIWIPWTIAATAVADRASSGSGTVIARVRPSVSFTEAQSEIETIMGRLRAEYPQTNATRSARLVEMGRLDDEEAGPAMMIVAATSALVLLLACANVANLLLARGLSRSRELAVRAAVGASRWRIARQLLVESLLLSIAAAIVGVLLAKVALDALTGALPEMVATTVPNIGDLAVDGATLQFTLAAAVLTTLLFGLLPAWRAARPRLQDGLKEGASTGGSRGTRRLRTALAIGEVALATLLLITAALLVRSYSRLQTVSPGFTADGLLTMAMTLPEDRYPTPERRRQFYNEAVARVVQLPGISSASFVNVLPFSTYDRGMRLVVDGAAVPQAGREPQTALRVITPGYFDTMDIPVQRGRAFDARDGEQSERVAIVNAAFARRYLGEGEAVGRRVRFGDVHSTGPWITIVGRVGDVHHAAVTQAPSPELYVPLSQAAGTTMMMLAVRVEAGRPEDMIPSVRSRILEVDPQQPVYHVKTMRRLVDDSMLPGSTAAGVLSVFSLVALVLAVIGVYGVVSYGVTQQMAEFGVRLALGATPRQLGIAVMRRSAWTLLAGATLGIIGAAALSGVMANLLYGVSGLDPATYAGASGVLVALGLLACLVPAWRAASAEPLAALRAE